jgi:hypothetical protein
VSHAAIDRDSGPSTDSSVWCLPFSLPFLLPIAERHPHGPAEGWIWLARLLNQEPRTATATVLLTFLEVGCETPQFLQISG